MTEELLAETNAAFSVTNDENEILEWLGCDAKEVGYELLTDDQIVELVIEDDSDQSENEDTEYDGSVITEDDMATAKDLRNEAKDAVTSMQKYIEWYQQQDEANHIDTMLLRRLRNLAIKKTETSVKQTKMTEFFTKP